MQPEKVGEAGWSLSKQCQKEEASLTDNPNTTRTAGSEWDPKFSRLQEWTWNQDFQHPSSLGKMQAPLRWLSWAGEHIWSTYKALSGQLEQRKVASPGGCSCEHHYLHPTQQKKQYPRANTSLPHCSWKYLIANLRHREYSQCFPPSRWDTHEEFVNLNYYLSPCTKEIEKYMLFLKALPEFNQPQLIYIHTKYKNNEIVSWPKDTIYESTLYHLGRHGQLSHHREGPPKGVPTTEHLWRFSLGSNNQLSYEQTLKLSHAMWYWVAKLHIKIQQILLLK